MSYDVEYAQHGGVIDESVKQRKASDNPSVTGLKLAAGAVASVPRQRGRGAIANASRVKLRSASIDFGCGPGRDLKVLAELSHTALPLEGSAPFAVMAPVGSGCEGCRRIPVQPERP